MKSRRSGWWMAMLLGSSSYALAADPDPQLVKALAQAPKQKGITPESFPADQCQGSLEKRSGVEGYLVLGPDRQVLRWFADTNGDRNVDLWSYFSGGIEIYRDIDSDFNGKVDQFRWLGTLGTRWGVDRNEDGAMDQWKAISAEEVTQELVEAYRDRDQSRVELLLLDDDLLATLGLGEERQSLLAQRLLATRQGMEASLAGQKSIDGKTQWSNFAADRPGILPAGTDGSTADLVVYENAVAVVDHSEGKPEQVYVGSMVQTAQGWRLIDLPKFASGGTLVQEGGFFLAATPGRQADGGQDLSGMSADVQALLAQLDKIDSRMADTSGEERQKLHGDRAELLEKLIGASNNDQELETWVRQYGETVSAAAQAGEFPEGAERLSKLEERLAELPKAKEALSAVVFGRIRAEHVLAISKPDANFQEIEENHLKGLKDFVERFPKSPEAPEAMLLVGLSAEFGGQSDEAVEWYARAAKDFPDTVQGKKADGATKRLKLAGQKMRITGRTVDGKPFDSAELGKQVIIVHYWASWCSPCKADMNRLRQLQAKFAKGRQLAIVGINVDRSAEDAIAFLKQEKNYPWIHLYEEGGMESNLSVKLGVLSLPVTLVIDPSGTVVASGTHFATDLEEKVESLLTPAKR